MHLLTVAQKHVSYLVSVFGSIVVYVCKLLNMAIHNFNAQPKHVTRVRTRSVYTLL